MAIEFGVFDYAFLVIGFLIGNYLENINRREYKKRKKVLSVVAVLGGGTIISYSLDEFFKVSTISFVTFWVGLMLGYFITRTRKEIFRSALELFRGFARAGRSKG